LPRDDANKKPSRTSKRETAMRDKLILITSNPDMMGNFENLNYPYKVMKFVK
jgi:hypothetical protein